MPRRSKVRKFPVVVELEFSKDDLQTILDAANFTKNPSRQVDDLTDEEFEQFKTQLQETPFIEEIMDGTGDACNNDWMCDFGPEE